MSNHFKFLLIAGIVLLFFIVTPGKTAGADYQVRIPYIEKAVQGQIVEIPVYLDEAVEGIGGFDFSIEYENTIASFEVAAIGEAINMDSGCGWEYFTYRLIWSNDDPRYTYLRFVGIAETNNGPVHPSCLTPESFPAELFTMSFKITNDRTYECATGALRFIWFDCYDNDLSAQEVSEVYVAEAVLNQSDDMFHYKIDITDTTTGYPTRTGYQPGECTDLTNLYPEIVFINGAIGVNCADPIDATGDVNLNAIAYEVSDLVLFMNYFPYGLGVFGINPEHQPNTTDVNRDKINLTVADWQYMKQIVIGDALPPQYLETQEALFYYVEKKRELFAYSDLTYGALFVILDGKQNPTVYPANMESIINYDQQNDQTRIFIYSIQNENFYRGEILGNLTGDIVRLEVSDNMGSTIHSRLEFTPDISENYELLPDHFVLEQNYPNPFNNATVINFSMPEASLVEFSIYNVLGKEVYSIKRKYSAGFHKLDWNGEKMSSGVYYYRLKAGDKVASKKMVLLK